MMSFKEFLISRVKLFFFLLPLTVTAFIVITLFFAPKMKLTYDILIPPLQLCIVGVLLSFVMYFRKQPTFRQYLLRLFLQLVLIQALFMWWLSPAEDTAIPAVSHHLIINGTIFVIYALGVLMVWLQRNRQSRQMTEQLKKLQRQQAQKDASEKALFSDEQDSEPVKLSK
ncbi:MAG: hypothetical protein IIU00_04180 [Clostridia bacterium]|nr:hypothetical protein [Clostridia bacterium]